MEKYITLKEFYQNQRKQSNLCDSQTSIFSDNCKKKSSFSSLSSINNEEKDENESKEGDSYDELDENEENEEKEDKKSSKNPNEDFDNDKKSENSEFYGNENDYEDEEEESDEKNEEEEEESSEKDENNDNSEKSFDNFNDIIPINDNNIKKEKKIKRFFKFKCPFCSVRIKISDKEIIINENILKINELSNNENQINNNENNKYFCELCNNVVEQHYHFEKYGSEHNNHLFELNKTLYDRAFDNLKTFYSSKNDIIAKIKDFLNGFNEYISQNDKLINESKNIFFKCCKYNSKFINVLKKSKKKLEKLKQTINKKHENKNLNLIEEIKFLENVKSFNQLINGVFYFPQLKMKLISEKNSENKSNLYFNYSFKEAYNQLLENGFFHFMRNKLFKIESKYLPFYSTPTKKNFLINSELNLLFSLKIPQKYSKSLYESSSDGVIIYGFLSKHSTGLKESSEFFSYNRYTKKIKKLANIPLSNFKTLDTIIYNDNKLFVIGGLNKYKSAITTCLYYNIEKNVWQKMPKLKYSRYNKALYIYGKDLIAFGGKCDAKDSSYIFEKIDLATLKNWENFTIKNFSSNIYNFGYCAYSQDIIFVIGGEDQVTEDYIKKGYVIDLKTKSLIEEFNIDDVLENNIHTPKFYRGILLSADKELYNIDFFNVWKRLHKLNVNLP